MHESTPPLAWDHEQMPFQPPSEAIAWKVRRYTGKPGRPPAVYGEYGVVHLDMNATVQDLRQAVRNESGSYRLYPVDGQGNELSPIACMELVPPESTELARLEPAESESAAVSAVVHEVIDLCKHMVKSRDDHDALITKVLSTLVTTTATIQRSTASLLGAANTTIQVANGVESLERQESPEQLDVDELSQQLAEALTPEDQEYEQPASSQPPWVMQLLSSPLGTMLLQFLQGFASNLSSRQAAQAPTTPAPAPASTSAPATEPRRNASPARATQSAQPSNSATSQSSAAQKTTSTSQTPRQTAAPEKTKATANDPPRQTVSPDDTEATANDPPAKVRYTEDPSTDTD